MANNVFIPRTAERKQAKIRINLSGPSGSGKTFSALKLAYGITGDWARICVIDTEQGSADLYSHLGPYQVITLTPPFSPERYQQALKAAADAADVVIIDSASHEWDGEGGILETADKMQGSGIQKWAKLTPIHKAFIGSLLNAPVHLITTTRKKQTWAIGESTNERGKAEVKKLGLADVQREGWEYEFTVAFEIDIAHLATASKDRSGVFMSRMPFTISEETGQELLAWAEGGAVDLKALKQEVSRQLGRIGVPGDTPPAKAKEIIHEQTALEFSDENLPEIVKRLKSLAPGSYVVPEAEQEATPSETQTVDANA